MRSVLLSLTCMAVRTITASSVYLLPQAEFGTMEYREVNAAQALSSVAHWLGLDRLDAHQPELVEQGASVAWDVQNVFGGEKSGKTLVIAFDGDNDVIPGGVRSAYSVPSSLDGILSALVTRARTIFGASSLHTSRSSSISNSNSIRQLLDPLTSSDSPAAQSFVSELEALSAFLDHDDDASPAFGAYRFAHFDTLKNELSSASYDEAVRAFHAAVSSARARNVRTALIHTPLSASFHNSRASDQPPQQPLPPSLPPSQPIFSTGTCFTTQEICSNKTSECSGRGQCQSVRRGNKECFVCACGKTVKSGKTTKWVGEKCERIDYSGPFVLLAGSTILIAILIAGSIAVLSSIGGHPLPSVLASVAVPGMKEGQ